MKKVLVVFLAIITTLCMAFGFAACGEKSDETGNAPSITDPSGGTQGSQGNQDGTQKPDEEQGGAQGGEQKPDKPTEPEKPAEKQIEVKVYIDNILTETLYTSSSKGYKIALPAKPEDMTSDPELKNYFDGWYADKGCTKLLTGEETYSAPSAIYGRNITSRMNDFSYTVNYGEATITRFTNSTATTVVVPRYINSFPVTTIGREAFLNKTMLRTVFLCEGLKEIEDSAFYNCNSMQKVVIPSSLTSIGRWAFGYCSGLTSVTIGNNVTSIENYAFHGCSGLTSLTIGSGVTSIAYDAFGGCSGLRSVIWNAKKCTEVGYNDYNRTYGTIFDGCSNLSSVTFGKDVEEIPHYAFEDCSGLTEIKVDSNNKTYHAKNNCLIETKSKTLIAGCKTSKIPDDGSVTEIGWGAFESCSGLTSVTIPNSVTSIESNAFTNCKGLTEIRYSGTIGSWKQIKKGSDWSYSTGNYTIYCTDGTITKDGKETKY